MKSAIGLVLFFVLLKVSFAFGTRPVVLRSPDGKIVYQFEIRKGQPGYSVSYQGAKLIEFSPLNIVFDADSLQQGMHLQNWEQKDSSEKYTLITGRSKEVSDSFRQVNLFLKEMNSPYRDIVLEVRAFNDGLAFRWIFPKGKPGDSLHIHREISGFNIAGNPLVHCLVLPNYHTSHEGFYLHRNYRDLPRDSLMDMPMLLSFSGRIFMAITEAALLDYSGMYLVKRNSGLVSNLSPLPGNQQLAVKAGLPHQSPWRVIMISDRPGRFLETNMLTDLAPPNRIADLSWIKPGKTTFPWWNGNVTADTLNAPGNNSVTQQYYIDFCARHHIEYHSVVEYGLHQWYQDDGVNFMPGPHPNVLKPVPGLDMKEVCDYAHSKGVGVRVWVHWAALYPKLDSAFALFEQWGLSGMMVDFMDRDDQEMVNIQTEILTKAAAHHLHIQFHGAYKPTGLSRTFPNEFTREGTLNYEHNKWNPAGVSPDHDLDIVFTRLIAGSTDYHLGGFRAVTPDKFRAQYTRPLMLGTRCHELAMYVVLENAISMVCDYPEAYENQPGFDFIENVPTTWDETKVLTGIVDQYIVIARKKNGNWWVGGITGNDPRSLHIPMAFLGNGNYRAEIYQDDTAVPFNPNAVLQGTLTVNHSSTLDIPLAAGGGFTIRLIQE